jgi:hypothetical protein
MRFSIYIIAMSYNSRVWYKLFETDCRDRLGGKSNKKKKKKTLWRITTNKKYVVGVDNHRRAHTYMRASEYVYSPRWCRARRKTTTTKDRNETLIIYIIIIIIIYRTFTNVKKLYYIFLTDI